MVRRQLASTCRNPLNSRPLLTDPVRRITLDASRLKQPCMGLFSQQIFQLASLTRLAATNAMGSLISRLYSQTQSFGTTQNDTSSNGDTRYLKNTLFYVPNKPPDYLAAFLVSK